MTSEIQQKSPPDGTSRMWDFITGAASGVFRGRRRTMINHPNRNRRNRSIARTSEGLRDILFDEIQELKSGDGDPQKSMAIANLAKQIVNTAKVELDFHRQMAAQAEAGKPVKMGTLQLGSAVSAAAAATGA